MRRPGVVSRDQRAAAVAGALVTGCLLLAAHSAMPLSSAAFTGVTDNAGNTWATALSFSTGQWTQVSAGDEHTCGIDTLARAWCWGSGANGRLGTGDTSQHLVPTRVSTSTGMLTVKAITAGAAHTCAIDLVGAAWCWGSGVNGKLGNGGTGDQLTPTKVSILTGMAAATAIAAGDEHTCAIDLLADAWCWGADGDGQLGNAASGSSATPSRASTAAMTANVAAIDVGALHTCAIAGGKAWCWGRAADGQLGDGQTSTSKASPTAVIATSMTGTIATIGLGARHSCAVESTGAPWCWGDNADGQLGIGGAGASWPTPQAVSTAAMPATIAGITGGERHACAFETGGTPWCWGAGGDGQLGNGSIQQRTTPTAVDTTAMAATIGAMDAGGAHTVAIDGGQVGWAWGRGSAGQLGNGTTTPAQTTPTFVGPN